MQRTITIAAYAISGILGLLGVGTLTVLTLSGEPVTGTIGASLYLALAILILQLTRLQAATTTQTDLLELMLEQQQRARPSARGES
jgi:hypothetical protein